MDNELRIRMRNIGLNLSNNAFSQAVFKEEEGWYWCVATNSLLDDNRDIEMVETGAYLEVTARPEQPVDEQPPPPTTTTTTTTATTRRLVPRTTHRPRQSQQKVRHIRRRR